MPFLFVLVNERGRVIQMYENLLRLLVYPIIVTIVCINPKKNLKLLKD